MQEQTPDPDWHRDAVGGMWEEIGKLQFDFLKEQGLQPKHRLLDIGCGSLRGGVHFVRYLDSGNYVGVDKNRALLDAGRTELERCKLTRKELTLIAMQDFDFRSLGREFDYALAHSLFTHLSLNSITRCIVSVDKVLAPQGQLYTTFFENPDGRSNLEALSHPSPNEPPLVTYFDEDPYHYDFKTFEWICEGTCLTVEYIGEWAHPRDQKMMVFTKR